MKDLEKNRMENKTLSPNRIKINIYRDNGEEVEINASSWSYVLLKYNDGMFGVIIKADLTGLTNKERLTAAEILLDGVLGEKKES